jgi:hypothetical protein
MKSDLRCRGLLKNGILIQKNGGKRHYGYGIRFTAAGTAEKWNLAPKNGVKRRNRHGIRFTTAGTAEK